MQPMRIVIASLLTAFLLLSGSGCAKKTEEDKIRKLVSVVQKAAEDRDVKEVLSHLDKAYQDSQGNDYQAIKGLLLYYFFRHQSITIIVSNLEVTVNGPSATVRFQAVLSGRSGASGDILPEALGAYQFDVSLKKGPDDWKIVSAKWERWGERMPDGSQSR